MNVMSNDVSTTLILVNEFLDLFRSRTCELRIEETHAAVTAEDIPHGLFPVKMVLVPERKLLPKRKIKIGRHASKTKLRESDRRILSRPEEKKVREEVCFRRAILRALDEMKIRHFFLEKKLESGDELRID